MNGGKPDSCLSSPKHDYTISILPGSRVFKVILWFFFFYISMLFKVTSYSVFFFFVFFLHVSPSSHMVHPLISIQTIINTKTKPLLLWTHFKLFIWELHFTFLVTSSAGFFLLNVRVVSLPNELMQKNFHINHFHRSHTYGSALILVWMWRLTNSSRCNESAARLTKD